MAAVESVNVAWVPGLLMMRTMDTADEFLCVFHV